MTIAFDREHLVDENVLRSSEVAAVARRRRRLASVVFSWRVLLLVSLLVGWYYASGRVVDSLFVSNPVAIARAFKDELSGGHLMYQLRYTVEELLLGYACGVVGGILAAVILAMSRTLERSLRPYLMALYALPTIAIAPLFVIWFGFGLMPKVTIAALFVFFIVFMMTLSGIRAVEGQLLDVARIMGAGRWQLMWKIMLPSAVPNLLAALRIAVPEAMVGVIIGEFIGGSQGIGYLIEASAQQYDTASVFAAIASLLVVVLLLDALLTVIERRLLRWRPTAGAWGPAGA